MPANEVCDKCGAPHPPLIECLSALKSQVQNMLLRTGRAATCPEPCNTTIFWMKHIDTGSNVPYTAEGLNHFRNCKGKFKNDRS